MTSTPSHVPSVPESASAGSVAAKVWDATRKLITITDHLKSLEKEDNRIQAQLLELSRTALDLVKAVHELSGQMKSIEKRFDDKDKMLEALIKLTIKEEIAKNQNGSFYNNSLERSS